MDLMDGGFKYFNCSWILLSGGSPLGLGLRQYFVDKPDWSLDD